MEAIRRPATRRSKSWRVIGAGPPHRIRPPRGGSRSPPSVAHGPDPGPAPSSRSAPPSRARAATDSAGQREPSRGTHGQPPPHLVRLVDVDHDTKSFTSGPPLHGFTDRRDDATP